nr:unnamed protein product [Digitaria exilis]
MRDPDVSSRGEDELYNAAAGVAAAALALWLLPVVLLCLPLCCAARFRRRLRKKLQSMRATRGNCAARGGHSEIITTAVDAGDRAWLLHRYLHDQMELVAAPPPGQAHAP